MRTTALWALPPPALRLRILYYCLMPSFDGRKAMARHLFRFEISPPPHAAAASRRCRWQFIGLMPRPLPWIFCRFRAMKLSAPLRCVKFTTLHLRQQVRNARKRRLFYFAHWLFTMRRVFQAGQGPRCKMQVYRLSSTRRRATYKTFAYTHIFKRPALAAGYTHTLFALKYDIRLPNISIIPRHYFGAIVIFKRFRYFLMTLMGRSVIAFAEIILFSKNAEVIYNRALILFLIGMISWLLMRGRPSKRSGYTSPICDHFQLPIYFAITASLCFLAAASLSASALVALDKNSLVVTQIHTLWDVSSIGLKESNFLICWRRAMSPLRATIAASLHWCGDDGHFSGVRWYARIAFFIFHAFSRWPALCDIKSRRSCIILVTMRRKTPYFADAHFRSLYWYDVAWFLF